MKVNFTSLFILFFSFSNLQSQVIEPSINNSSQELYDFHIVKHRKNKTTAWIMLGGGFTITMAGLIVNSADEATTALTLGLIDVEEEHGGDWMIYLGGAATLASIPFFISAGKNKRKAELKLKNSISNNYFRKNNRSNYLSVSLTIPF